MARVGAANLLKRQAVLDRTQRVHKSCRLEGSCSQDRRSTSSYQKLAIGLLEGIYHVKYSLWAFD